MYILEENISEPSIYPIYLGGRRFSDDGEEAEEQLARKQKDIVKMDTHLKENLGGDWDLASNHVREIRTKMEGKDAHYQLILAANHERGAMEMLEKHFSE